jgi:hypothetical protein
METVNRYIIADFGITVSFEQNQANGCHLLPSYEPFRVAEEAYSKCNDKLFSLHVDDTLRPLPKEKLSRIKDVDTGNGITIVDQTDEGGYQFIVKDVFGGNCCLLQTDKEFGVCRCALAGTESMRTFGLNNAIMLVFAFAGCRHDTVLIHASLVRHNGWGYAFTAKSGTGKSTHTSLWLRYIPGCDLMNDDNPVIRIVDGTPYIYGSPWSGKTPCYRNVKAPLGAMVALKRDTTNHVEAATTIESFSTLITACSTMKWDSGIVDNICSVITKIIGTTPNYNLYCRPDREAAIICQKAIARNGKSR